MPISAANRLQHWAHILSAFDYEIHFVKSERNSADFLSRSPLPKCESTKGKASSLFNNKQDTASYLNYSVESNLPLDFSKIKRETAVAKILSKVFFYIKQGWPVKCPSAEFLPFFTRKHELSIEQGCIMWGYRLIIPEKYRNFILSELHSAHMGIVKMKSLARSYIWWPNLDQNLEKNAQNCNICLKYSSKPPRAPLIVWDWPKEVWSRVHIDFFGPCFGNYFFVLEDASSKWIECFNVANITAKTTINILHSLFARFGLPKELCSDNAPTFTGAEFYITFNFDKVAA